MQDPIWKKTMHQEIFALEENHTWVYTPLSLRKTTLGSKWVYKIKYNTDGVRKLEQLIAEAIR